MKMGNMSAPTGEEKTSKDLVEKAEKRGSELKTLISEQYAERWEYLEKTLDKCAKDFGEVIDTDDQIDFTRKNAFEKITKSLEEGDLTAAQKELADLKKYQEQMDIRRNMHPSIVRSVLSQVQEFMNQFGLKEYVRLRKGMTSDEIKRAIELGWEAKMYELQNRIED